MQQSKQVVLEFLTAVQKGENDKLGGYLHPAIEWDQPGSNEVSGKKKGIGEVFAMVGKMFELSGNTLMLADIKVLAENGDSIACLLNWKAGAGGKRLDVDNIDVYQVKEGQIIAAKIYSANLGLENEFWGGQ
ncbi:MAG: nuclear transport factor 2 family protein [Bacteroidota bacterium]